MQTTDRAGYDVLQENYAVFCDSGIDPVCMACKLFQAKLINSGVKDECTVQGCRRDLQLKSIIDAVMRQGKPGAFQEFTEIIAADCSNSWRTDKLKVAYNQRGGKWIEKGSDHPAERSVSYPPLEECPYNRELSYPPSNHPSRGHAPHPSVGAHANFALVQPSTHLKGCGQEVADTLEEKFGGQRLSHEEASSHGPSEIAVCTLVAEETAGADHCLVSSDGGSTKLTAYKMMTSPHGIALIISNIEFDKPYIGRGIPNRTGGDVDEKNLQDLFGPDCLNYKVVLLKNLTGEQIETAFCLVSGHKGHTYDAVHEHDREALKALSDGGNLISKDHDSFVCCLLSHGNKGIVYGTDGKKFDLNCIYYYLGPCKHLEGKPKMAFIQACQGTKTAVVPPPCVEDDGDDFKTTETCDFILSYAAFHGQKCFRWTEGKGTWYISALCRIFKENHKKMDVASMITDVHKEVTNTKSDDLRQCPRLEHTLRHNVHFAVKARQGAEQM